MRHLADEVADGAARDVMSREQETKRLIERVSRMSTHEIARVGDYASSLNSGDANARVAAISTQAGDSESTKALYGLGPESPADITLDNVEQLFQYRPWGGQQAEQGQIVRETLVAAAKAILRVVPRCPDRSVALRKLREVRMDVNSAITHGRF